VGVDLSEEQLAHARRLQAEAGVSFPLVHASAEAVPLADAGFDIAFCDHGAFTFADPYRLVPEAARLLRDGGLLAFNMSTPFVDICWPAGSEEVTERLWLDYFGLHEVETGEVDHVEFNLPYGEWIRLFRRSGFVVEDLIELRPAEDAVSSYRSDVARAWARRWPMEHIWKVRRLPR
jgi:ubiquinone/menaquinone biosynthesis C-methylase UbiE